MKRFELLIIKSVALVYISAFTVNVSAQGYDWVRTLHGISIVNLSYMTVDSYNNSYVGGGFRLDLSLDTNPLYELESNYGHTAGKIYFMKVSSDGSCVWHKYLYGNNQQLAPAGEPSIYNNFRMLGDTALFAYAHIYFPSQPRQRLLDSIYIIDTLLFSNDTGFLPPHFFDSVERFQRIGFPMLLSAEDGHLQEYHTLEQAFVGDNGQLHTRYFFNGVERDTTRLYFDAAWWYDFEIDCYGNFVGVPPTPPYLFRDGVRSMCYMVDNERRYEITPPEDGSVTNLLVKFSPHFDSLLAYHWLFDSVGKSFGCSLQCIKTDSQGNIYTSWLLDVPTASLPMHLTFAGNSDLGLDVTHNYEGFLVKFSPDFVPLWVKHLRSDWPWVGNPIMGVGGIAIDEDSSAVFVAGSAYDISRTLPINIDSTVIDIHHSRFMFRFDIDDGRLVSYGKMDYPDTVNSLGPHAIRQQIAAARGRVWFNITFQKGFTYDDTIFFTPDTNGTSYGEGVVVMDYQGKLIDFIDFRRTICPEHGINGRFLAQNDSVLTLGFYYGSGEYSWFGDTCVIANDDIGVIARYVDPAYAIPYGQQPMAVPYTPLRGSDLLAVWPNPTHNVVHLACRGVRAVWLVAADGRRTQLQCKDGTVSLKAFAPGLYVLEVQTADGFYKAKVVRE